MVDSDESDDSDDRDDSDGRNGSDPNDKQSLVEAELDLLRVAEHLLSGDGERCI